jgi:hypothetical protein
MAARGIVYLMYHELELPGRRLCQSEPGYVRYILSETSFRTQMDWLRRNGWQGLSVSEALTFPDGKSVAFTFDDGSETDLIVAAPILKESVPVARTQFFGLRNRLPLDDSCLPE